MFLSGARPLNCNQAFVIPTLSAHSLIYIHAKYGNAPKIIPDGRWQPTECELTLPADAEPRPRERPLVDDMSWVSAGGIGDALLSRGSQTCGWDKMSQ